MYNPYDLISMRINNQEMHGRPTAFDSEVVDNNSMTNADGNVVKPTKVSTTCPDCGCGLEYTVMLGEPPFNVVNMDCYYCVPATIPVVDPFMNPVGDGRIGSHELDPLLHDPGKQIISSDETSVADRFDFSDDAEKAKEDTKKTTKKKTKAKVAKRTQAKKKAKKRPSRAKKKPDKEVVKEPAEGVGEEVNFDDDDLIEIE